MFSLFSCFSLAFSLIRYSNENFFLDSDRANCPFSDRFGTISIQQRFVYFLWFNAIHMCVQDEDHRRLNCLFILSSAAVNGFMGLLWRSQLQFRGQFRDPNEITQFKKPRSRNNLRVSVLQNETFFVFRPQKRPRWHKQMTSNLFRPKLSRQS